MKRNIAIVSAALCAVAGSALADQVTITARLDYPDQPDSGLYYRLTGQSVYFSLRTSSLTTGGQLDGLDSFASDPTGVTITFEEVFPEAELTDYLRFGYFGVVETLRVSDDGEPDSVIDRSIVIAGKSNMFGGLRVEDLLPGLDEMTLLDALTNSFDSPEFFSALGTATSDQRLQGDIRLLTDPSDDNPSGEVRTGESIGLYGFFDEATEIGYLATTVYRPVPSPGAICILGMAGLAGARRRRS